MTAQDHVISATRLAAVAATGLVRAAAREPDPLLRRLAEVAQSLVGAPLVGVTLITADEQLVLTSAGRASARLPSRHLPLVQSLCQHVVRSGAMSTADDVTACELLRDSLSITELGIRAYLGSPLTTSADETIGRLCAIDFKSRAWHDADRTSLTNLAAAVTTHLERLTPESACAPYRVT